MALCKRSTRTGLQTLLETNGGPCGGEFHENHKGPGALGHRMTARTVIVPVQSIQYVAGDPHVVARWIGIGSEDVNNPLLDSVHAWTGRTDWARAKSAQLRGGLLD